MNEAVQSASAKPLGAPAGAIYPAPAVAPFPTGRNGRPILSLSLGERAARLSATTNRNIGGIGE